MVVTLALALPHHAALLEQVGAHLPRPRAMGGDGGRWRARVGDAGEGWRGLRPLEQVQLSVQTSCAGGSCAASRMRTVPPAMAQLASK
eukprot:scaffold80544_cov61-Phaeocystis_antarctica.AAC.2